MSRRTGPSNFLVFVLFIAVAVLAYFDKPWAARVTSEDDVKRVVENYIQQNPEKIVASLQNMQQKQMVDQAEGAKKGISEKKDEIENNASTPVVGNLSGDVTVVEFFDYSCGYCKKVFPDVKKLVETDKNVKLVMKELPILGPDSELAAKAALAVYKLDKSKYFQYHAALMEFQGAKSEAVLLEQAKKLGLNPEKVKEEMKSTAIAEAIAADRALAASIGIRGTPAFIIAGELIPGSIPYETLNQKVTQARGGKASAEPAANPEAEPAKPQEE